MEMRPVLCTVILLISLVITDARAMGSVSTDENVSSACEKCLVISRRAEAALNSQKLFDEAHKLSGEACHLFPTTLQDKCLKKSGAYLHKAREILQELFEEGHLCNGTGLCAKSESSVDNCLVNEFSGEVQDERGCATCRRAVKELFTRLKNPKMRSKIVEALLDYCEEAEEDEDQCKQTMYQFGPIILRKLETYKPSELCSLIGMCEEEIAMKMKISL